MATIFEARALMMLASGEKKSFVVKIAIEAPVCTEITASAIQLFNNRAEVVLDKGAATELKCI